MSHEPQILPPMNAAILIGGASARMGAPKHLISEQGQTWLDRTIAAVSPIAARLVLVGRGVIPPEYERISRLADAAELAGPLAGILAALRSDAGGAWLVVACDLPRLTADALKWLIEQRRAGAAGVIPTRRDGRAEPLLAIYEPGALEAVEALVRQGRSAPRELVGYPGFLTPSPPAALEIAWTNVNTPAERAALDG